MKPKLALDCLREVLEDRPWCPRCGRFLLGTEIGYSQYSNCPNYHRDCGEDVQNSDMIDAHVELIQEAVRELERLVGESE